MASIKTTRRPPSAKVPHTQKSNQGFNGFNGFSEAAMDTVSSKAAGRGH